MNKANSIQVWINYHRNNGRELNADEIWNKINQKWPNLSEQEKESIFQKVN